MATTELEFRCAFSYKENSSQNSTITCSHHFIFYLQDVSHGVRLKLIIIIKIIIHSQKQNKTSRILGTSAENSVREGVEIGDPPPGDPLHNSPGS